MQVVGIVLSVNKSFKMRLRHSRKGREMIEDLQLKEGFFMLLRWKSEGAKMFTLNFPTTIREAIVILENYSVMYTNSQTHYYVQNTRQ